MGVDATGKPVRLHRRARNKTEATHIRNELRKQKAEGLANRGNPRLTVADVVEGWFTNVASRTSKDSTLETNHGYIEKRILPALGPILVDRLTVQHLDDAYAAWLSDEEKPLSASTVRKLHAILSAAFSSARKRGLVDRDVTKLVTPPSPKRFEEQPLTLDEIRSVLRAAEDTDDLARWLVALMLGLRQGEALGLRWEDVHLPEAYLVVTASLGRRRWKHGCSPSCGQRAAVCPQRHGGGLVSGTPKSGSSREVALPELVVQALADRRLHQTAARNAAGNLWVDHGLVFTNAHGGPIDPKHDYQAWQSILRAAGVRKTRLHNARHSAGTLMGSLGIPLRVIQEAFGHSSAKVTERYVHVRSESLRIAAAQMDEALNERDFGSNPMPTETGTETSDNTITLAGVIPAPDPSRNRSRLSGLNRGPTRMLR